MKAKDLFVLAVRLVGLYFIGSGLKNLAVPTFTDVTILKGDDVNDVISTLLPVVFNLAVGWWLLGCRFLIRRAYPEASKISDYLPAPKAPSGLDAPPASSQALTEMETAEKKLATLVGKPKNH
jgi:hypothetical protein